MDTASAPDPLPPPWWSPPGPAPLPPPPPSLLFLLMHAPPAYFRRARGEPNRVASGERTPAVRRPQKRTPASGGPSKCASAGDRSAPCTWLIGAQRTMGVARARSGGRRGEKQGARRGRRDQVTERQARRRTCRDAHVRRAARVVWSLVIWWSGKRRTGRVEASERARERERERRRARVGRRLRAGPCDAPGQFPRGLATARNWA